MQVLQVVRRFLAGTGFREEGSVSDRERGAVRSVGARGAKPSLSAESLRSARHLAIGSRIMLWYLRALGLIYFLSGLGHWAFILGVSGEGFADAATHIQAATIYFALLEVVAATGLWAGAAWGIAAWLFAAVAGIVIHVGFADLFGSDWITVAFHLITILAYAGLAWWTGASETPGETFRLPPD